MSQVTVTLECTGRRRPTGQVGSRAGDGLTHVAGVDRLV
jgi:hypothetical protein